MNDSWWECCIRERVMNDLGKVGNVRGRGAGEEAKQEVKESLLKIKTCKTEPS